SAAARASSTGRIPSCSPSGPITRTGLMRICRLTRTLRSVDMGNLLRKTNGPVVENGSGEHQRAGSDVLRPSAGSEPGGTAPADRRVERAPALPLRLFVSDEASRGGAVRQRLFECDAQGILTARRPRPPRLP